MASPTGDVRRTCSWSRRHDRPPAARRRTHGDRTCPPHHPGGGVMPEYLAPGVYVEETTFRQKSIEGVSTSTAGFVGPTRFGPTAGEPELLTSFLDFERIYSGIDQLMYDHDLVHNDLAHAVRGFFENGGRRLYVARTFTHTSKPDVDSAELGERYPDF